MSQSTLADFERRLAAGGDPALVADLEAAVIARRQSRGEHDQWGLLCEHAGLASLAFTEFQLALRDRRDDDAAAWRLAQLYHERGDIERALSLTSQLLERHPAHLEYLTFHVQTLLAEGAIPRALEALKAACAAGLDETAAERLRRLIGKRPPSASSIPAAESSPVPALQQTQELEPSDADCIRFHSLFAGREGVYARQWAKQGGDSGYSPVHEPLTPAVVRNHLLGTYTIGAYVLRLDATATFFALDLDIDKSALQKARGNPHFAQELRDTLRQTGRGLLDDLRSLGFHPFFENSGYKGRHLWVFLEQPQPGEVLQVFGRLFVASRAALVPPGLHLEFFPKQATLKGQGLGNLIKLPLGIHRRTGYRSLFLGDDGEPLPRQLEVLKSAVRAPQTVLYSAIEELKSTAADAGLAESAPWDNRGPAQSAPARPAVSAPAPPIPPAPWTEADFEQDRRIRHLFAECPVLTELRGTADEHRRLSHEEQLVLIHTLGHAEGGPQAVNYLFGKCADVGPEKFMKDRLKGNPVSCPSIRKKIPHVTRRVACNCPFEFASDRYPTPVLHLLTLAPETQPAIPPAPNLDHAIGLAERFGILERKREDIQREWETLRGLLVEAISRLPDRQLPLPDGHYRIESQDGIDRLIWTPAAAGASPPGM